MSATRLGHRYPDIVRAGIHLLLDTPPDVMVRLDPDGPSKAEERRRRSEGWQERKRASGFSEHAPDPAHPAPKLLTVHLQWLGTSAGQEAWVDAPLVIDLDRRRLHGSLPFLLGGGHQGSAAVGVLVVAAPALLAISPYLWLRARAWRQKEAEHEMSRHAIVLTGKLRGQLDATTEALLREVLQNEWRHARKLSRRISFRDACALLDGCDLIERHMEPVVGDPLQAADIRDLHWHDADGDHVAHLQLIDGRLHACRVLGSTFEEAQALRLTGRFRTRTDVKDED